MNYQKNIKRLISESGLKITFIAEKLGIKYDTFRRKLKGETEFKTSELIELCKILNINLMEVFKNE